MIISKLVHFSHSQRLTFNSQLSPPPRIVFILQQRQLYWLFCYHPNSISNHHPTNKFHKVLDEIHLEQYLEVGKYPSYPLGIVLILQITCVRCVYKSAQKFGASLFTLRREPSQERHDQCFLCWKQSAQQLFVYVNSVSVSALNQQHPILFNIIQPFKCKENVLDLGYLRHNGAWVAALLSPLLGL